MTQKKIVVLGMSSFIGYNLFLSLLKIKKYDIYGTYFTDHSFTDNAVKDSIIEKVDITNKDALLSYFNKIRPDVIINCVGLSNVDDCEKNYVQCHNLNFEPTTFIVSYCQGNFNVKYVYFSSSQVFDGCQQQPYDEDDIPRPRNHYGQCKHASEQLIKTLSNFVIIRPSTVFGLPEHFQHGNIFNYVYKDLTQGNKFSGYTDMIRTPCYIIDVSTMVEKIITLDRKGIFHVGSEVVSIDQFARKIAQVFGLDEHLVVGKKADIKDIRPRNGALDCRFTEKELGIKFTLLVEALRNMKEKVDCNIWRL